MAESDRRHRYAYNRVLIETERILDPQFADAVVFLSGAQLEMLRNVTQYLNRRSTYVSEQFADYYLAPTVEDYDTILAIVADMEESLMGNPNTIWGYKETFRDPLYWADADAGNIYLETTPIASGKVCRLEGMAFRNDTTQMSRVIIKLKSGGSDFPLLDILNPTAATWHTYSVDRTMAEGDFLEFEMQGVVQNDGVSWQMVGRQMDVPE